MSHVENNSVPAALKSDPITRTDTLLKKSKLKKILLLAIGSSAVFTTLIALLKPNIRTIEAFKIPTAVQVSE